MVIDSTVSVTCDYECTFHKGKIEWHHPIFNRFDAGFYLCEAHHSILQGRKKKYIGELTLGKDLSTMYIELKGLERWYVENAGCSTDQVDKH